MEREMEVRRETGPALGHDPAAMTVGALRKSLLPLLIMFSAATVSCGETTVPPEPEPPEDTADFVLGPGPHLDSLYPIQKVGGDTSEGRGRRITVWEGECLYQGTWHGADLWIFANPEYYKILGKADSSRAYVRLKAQVSCVHPWSPDYHLEWWAGYDVENDSLVLQVDSTGFDKELILPTKFAIDSMSADSCWIETLSTNIKVPVGGGDGDPGVYAARGDTALDTLGFSMTFGPARRAGERPECEGG